MIRIVALAAVTGVIAPTSSVAAERCRLVIDETRHIDGPCRIERHRGGGFGIDAGRTSKAFAVVYVAPSGAARAYWNASSGKSKADVDLGHVEREGACWANARVAICAWAGASTGPRTP